MSRKLESLLKYQEPVLTVRNTDRKPLRGGKGPQLSRQLVTGPGTIPGHSKPPCPGAKGPQRESEELLDIIFPPRQWMEGHHLYTQKVSTAPSTREDVVRLERLLDTKLWQKQAKETGISPERSELYSQCFDELIRQVTVSCAERGQLLTRVRNESHMTISALKVLCGCSTEYSTKKAQQAEKDKTEREHNVSELQAEVAELKKQLREEELECKSISEAQITKQEMELNAHLCEIEFLKRANKQLETQLALIFPS